MASLGMTGMHGLPMHRQWVDIQRLSMPYSKLDPHFDGFRIIQMSDLHYSPVVWKKYLVQFIEWINALEPDLVVVTGDLVTGGYRYSASIAHILEQIRSTHGVVCTFGNHDYTWRGKRDPAEGLKRARHLEDCLEASGMIVLRNEVMEIKRPGAKSPLVIVGLDDEWSGNMDPDKAFATVDPENPILCLNHNPANCQELLHFPWQWMLSGHTHGRQLVNGALSRKLYGHLFRHYTHGYYAVNGRHLYVNRGLSYGQRRKRWCRPELTVFRLGAA